MSLPSNSTTPLLGSTKPPTTRSVVVLPQPEGPRKVTKPLSGMSSESLSSTFSPSYSTTMSFRETITFCSISFLLFLALKRPFARPARRQTAFFERFRYHYIAPRPPCQPSFSPARGEGAQREATSFFRAFSRFFTVRVYMSNSWRMAS